MSTRMEDLRQDVRKNPADLEREADIARDAVAVTLHALERELSPSELVNRVIDSVKLNAGGFGENLVAQVRSNPVPALLTGVGVAWLMLSSRRAAAQDYGSESARAGAKISPDEGIDINEEVSRELHDRWSSAADTMHETASDASDAVGDAMSATVKAARTAAGTVRGAAGAVTDAASRTAAATRRATQGITRVSSGGAQRLTDGYSYLSREQPLVLGAVAMVVGAAIGALLPSTDAEDGWLGDVSDEAKARLKSEAHGTTDDLQAAAMSAATAVQQSMRKAGNGNGAAPHARETPSADWTDANEGRGADTST